MAKLIVDTSVWIDFFRGCLQPPVYRGLVESIREGMAVLTDVILHEILVGARNRDHFQELSRLFSPLECLRIADKELPSFNEFAWELRRKGLKGKYTDASIAFLSHRYEISILSFDGYFHQLARKGVIQTVVL